MRRRAPAGPVTHRLASSDPGDWLTADEQRELVDLVERWRAGDPRALAVLDEKYDVQDYELWGRDPQRLAVFAAVQQRRRVAGREFAAQSGRDPREVAAEFRLGWCAAPQT